MERKTTEEIMDDCIAEVLAMPGATSPDTPESHELKRDLRETTARLAAASPFMKPSEELRGRILQATAPTTFRMEDYRKAMKDNSRFFKWGFYAAMLFLMAAGWYNLSMATANERLLQTANQQKLQIQGLQELNSEMRETLVTFVTPDVQQITLVDAEKRPWARAWVDDATKRAVLILPQELAKSNSGQMKLNRSGTEVVYQTKVIGAPATFLAGQQPKGIAVEAPMVVRDLHPDTTSSGKAFTATMGP